jgi:hypothetical protein
MVLQKRPSSETIVESPDSKSARRGPAALFNRGGGTRSGGMATACIGGGQGIAMVAEGFQ